MQINENFICSNAIYSVKYLQEVSDMEDNMTRRLYLLRHAEPEVARGIYYGGGTDLPLSYEGTLRARNVGAKLGINPTNLFTSTMKRSRQTLELMFPTRKDSIKEVEGMHEIVMGEWELKSFDEVHDKWGETFEIEGVDFADCHCPGGETFRQVQTRAVAALEKLLADTDGDLFIATHGGVIWTLLCHYFDFNLNNVFYYPMQYCSICELEQKKSGMRLVRFNWTPELAVQESRWTK